MNREDSLEWETTTHSNILAWIIPWTEELGGLMGHGATKSYTQLSMHSLSNNLYSEATSSG